MSDRPTPRGSGRNDETWRRKIRVGDTEVSDAKEVNMEPPLTIGQRFCDYEILELRGRGSSGFVYAALDRVANRRIALKVLCRNSPQDLCRNKLGFRRMSRLRHPRLLWAQGITEINGYCVLLMEEVEGQTLSEFVRQIAEMPKREALHRFHIVMHDYAVGLSVMHLNELVHRDFKPSNLMVRRDGRGVIVDYGLVAHCDAETDPRGIRSYIAGTPKYFSPEALWEQSYTPAGDVFSLGLVFLDCLKVIVGRGEDFRHGEFKEWDREEDEQTIASLLSTIDDSVPALIRMVIAEMLTIERGERPTALSVASMTNIDGSPVKVQAASYLFGRERELEICENWLERIQKQGHGRLHFWGDAGSGKSRFLDDVERFLRQKRWATVFRANCRSREIDRLQVMDQIADQVAQRYMRRDLPPIQLHPVNVTLLVNAFPQLTHILPTVLVDEDDETVTSFTCPLSDRQDLTSAWVSLCVAMRKAAPLFLLVDDAQWADPDGRAFLHELEQQKIEGLGVITASREGLDPAESPEALTLEIGPLSNDDAFAFLQSAAHRWRANINPAGLGELIEFAGGNPFRLQELADEMRPEGLFHELHESTDESISNVGELDRLWRARFDRLTNLERSVLAFIVAARTPVSLADLAKLSGLGDRIDGAIFELSRQRLVQDDATGQECISVVADATTDALIAHFSDEEMKRAHLAWAKLLSESQKAKSLATRIAKHFYAADQAGDALPYAIMAAEHADRTFSKREAGEWHERVLEQVTGSAREKHLRDAARCFYQADLPAKASQYFVTLADQAASLTEGHRFRAIAAKLLIRCGELERARPYLNTIAEEFEFDDDIRSCDNLLASLRAPAVELLIDAESRILSKSKPISSRELRYCGDLGASLAFFDIRQALRFVVHGSFRALHRANDNSSGGNDSFHFAAVSNLWNVMLNCASASKATEVFERISLLRERLRHQHGHPDTAEFSRTLTMLKLFSMSWSELSDELADSMCDFSTSHSAKREPERIESRHLLWIRLWSHWQMGNWREMSQSAVEIAEDADRRSDVYQRLLTTTGLAGNSLLVRGESERLKTVCLQHQGRFDSTLEIQPAEFICEIQRVNQLVYEADYSAAAKVLIALRERVANSIIRRIALVRVLLDQSIVLVSLHQRELTGDSSQFFAESVLENSIRRLEGHASQFGQMLGAHFRGIFCRQNGNADEAIAAWTRASILADRQSLNPFRLAADQASEQLRSAARIPARLRHAMMEQGVAEPEKLERLYTVARLRS